MMNPAFYVINKMGLNTNSIWAMMVIFAIFVFCVFLFNQ